MDWIGCLLGKRICVTMRYLFVNYVTLFNNFINLFKINNVPSHIDNPILKELRSISSLFLASIVFIASIGVTVNLHLCGGEVRSVALFVKAKPCPNEIPKACHGSVHHSKNNGCCEEESFLLKGKETNAEVKTATQITPSFKFITVILPVLYSIASIDSFIDTPKYAYYKPPLIEQDITVLVHSFLI